MAIDGVTRRIWTPADVEFLWDMLYASLHVPMGGDVFPRSVLDEPAISHYLRNFGARDGDDAQVAVGAGGARLGAAWCRRLPADDPGYGFVADDVPELGMAVVASWRGRGLGTALMTDLLHRHPTMSLSVDDDNFRARQLYERFGFVAVANDGGSTTMLRRG